MLGGERYRAAAGIEPDGGGAVTIDLESYVPLQALGVSV
jgi:hypothetical protein